MRLRARGAAALAGALVLVGAAGWQLARRPAPSLAAWDVTSATVGLAGAGVDPRSLPVFHGQVRPGSTLSRVRVEQALDLSQVRGVTLDRVWLAPQGGRRALVLGPGTVVRSSDIDGSHMQQGERIGVYGNVSGSYLLDRVSVTGMSVGAWLDGSGLGQVTGTYIHAMTSLGGAHVDGLTRRAGTGPLLVRGSRIDASGPRVTGALFLQSTWGAAVGGVSVEDCYLEGAGYVVRLEGGSSPVSARLSGGRVRAEGWGPLLVTGGAVLRGWSTVEHVRRGGS